jgi:hypothetical protein
MIKINILACLEYCTLLKLFCTLFWVKWDTDHVIYCNKESVNDKLTRNVFVRNTMSPSAPLWFLFCWPLTLKDDLDLSPLKMCSSMRYTCMLFIPLTLKDYHDLSPLNMCSFMRYTCMSNIKLLSSILQKLWQMLKLEQTNTQTNQPTSRQGKNNMSPTISGGGHKNGYGTCHIRKS